MNKKNLVVGAILAGFGLLILCLECSDAAKDKTTAPAKIGIVSIREIFDNCAMKTETEKTLAAEGDKRFAEIKKLEQDIDNDKTALGKFKEGSQEYMDLLKGLMMKQSQLDAGKEFYQQEFTLKEMRSKEDIYRKILDVIAKVAKEKGYDIILNRDDNYLNQPETSPPAQNPTDLILTTRTHKLLYFNKDLDITAEVLIAMNSGSSK
ncbi:MAG: OmpH family outer membrane protein [Phycisphaerae bacterium]|jgi:Skp family chaperone for outer membrane proteins